MSRAFGLFNPFRAAARVTPDPVMRVTRIVHKLWWSDGEVFPGCTIRVSEPGWVPFQTYRWASHGCWTIPTEPWVIVEEQPW